MKKRILLPALSALTLAAITASASSSVWEPQTPIQQQRSYGPAAAANGRIYLFGGVAAGYLSSVEEYDPTTATWQFKRNLPVSVRSMPAVEVGGKIYLFGGHDGSTTYSNVWQYDPLLDTYTERRPMSTSRFMHDAAVVDDLIYVFGGAPYPYDGILDSVEVYDPSQDLWCPPSCDGLGIPQPAPMPRPRAEFAAAAVGTRIYLVAGGDLSGNVLPVDVFDTQHNTWETLSGISIDRAAPSAAALNGRLFVVGGVNAAHVEQGTLVFDPARNVWSIGPDLHPNRHGMGVTVLNDSIFAIAGNQLTTVERLTGEVLQSCAEEKCSQDVLCDFGGGSFCGTRVGNPTHCLGACNDGLCSQGDGYVVLGDDDAYSASNLEIEFQVRLSRLPQPGENASALVTKYTGHSGVASEWGVFVEKDQRWMLCGDGSLCVMSPTGVIETGVLYSVRARLTGPVGELWVNGTLTASGAIARNPANTPTPVVIANSNLPGHNNPFYGMIDEVRIGCLGNGTPSASCADASVLTDPGLCSAFASIDNGSSDPDGDLLQLTQAPPPPYSPGESLITLTATDPAGAADSCEATVTVTDQERPQIFCPEPMTLECTSPAGAVAAFQASASDNCSVMTDSCTPPSGSTFPLGTTQVSCTAHDPGGNSASCGLQVIVTDRSAPVVSAAQATPSLLWPPNNKMVPVSVSVTALDACDPGASCRIIAVASNEPYDPGDPDWQITGPLAVALRARRSGSGDGRVYTISLSCVDASGNSSPATAVVTVPHDRRVK